MYQRNYSMPNMKAVKTNLLSALALTVVGISGLAAYAQPANSPIPMPPAKPKVDQLGTMEQLPQGDQTILFLMLFLQVGFSIFVAVALASHLSMPPRHKS